MFIGNIGDVLKVMHSFLFVCIVSLFVCLFVCLICNLLVISVSLVTFYW
jgi:hypothetical protein